MTARRYFTIALVVLFSTVLGVRATIAQRGATDDGLEQIDGRFRLTYVRPGVSFDRYRRIALIILVRLTKMSRTSGLATRSR